MVSRMTEPILTQGNTEGQGEGMGKNGESW